MLRTPYCFPAPRKGFRPYMPDLRHASSEAFESEPVVRLGATAANHRAGRLPAGSPLGGGVGADIAAQVNEQAFLELQAPVARVTGFDTIMPYARKEDIYMPNTIDIQSQIEKTLNFS